MRTCRPYWVVIIAIGWSFLGLVTNSNSYAQSGRITDRNATGWYNLFGNIRLGDNWSVHAECQFRRSGLMAHSQQNLIRTGIQHQVNPRLMIRVGYANIETFVYGDIPINAMSKPFTEHRSFQMAQLTDQLGKWGLTHRWMLEQRWIGKYSNAALVKEDIYTYINRFRYQCRIEHALASNPTKNQFYAAAFDELFIGFGNQVAENIFDQNRVGVLLGYEVKDRFRIEGGYLNQIVLFGREINGSNVIQRNNGVVLNILFTVDVRP
ncbi:MAG: DUF2490 domain-containing protein [Ferruginibacter sp.]